MSDAPGAATFRAPADACDRHVGRYGRELARALIAAADVHPRRRALDVSCGPGAPTSELVALPSTEHVAAVDPSAPFADACRRPLPGVRGKPAKAITLAITTGTGAFEGRDGGDLATEKRNVIEHTIRLRP